MLLLTGALAFLFAQCVLALLEDQDCGRIPTSLWCKNEEIAKRCGVDAQCATYNKESADKKLQLTVLFEGLCPDCQVIN
jgi:hypothetical protein